MKPRLQEAIACALQSALHDAGDARKSVRQAFFPWEAVRQIGAARAWLGLASGFMAHDREHYNLHKSSRARVRRVLEVVEREIEAAWPRQRRRAVVRR